jgi:pimeloyl-ACP methyl ester carboxylesterase
MPNPQRVIAFGSSRLYYNRSGTGPALLVFHGFGQDHRAFSGWMDALKDRYTLFLCDLYFHGSSTWPDQMPLEKKDWKEIIGLLLKEEQITSFDVAGFSMGGKFALATLEGFPNSIKKMILVAADGITVSPWYRLATAAPLRGFFRSMILKPGRFHATVRFFRSLGLLNNGAVRFAESQMDTEENRNRVYCSWVYFRHLRFRVRDIAAIINQFHISVLIIAGKFDRVIPPKNMDPLIKRLDHKQVEILEAGHHDLVAEALKFIR